MHQSYFTFGQIHAHNVNGKTLDHDCVAVIEASGPKEARALAVDWFDNQFHMHYKTKPGEELMSYFPRGFIHLNTTDGENHDTC